MTLLQARPPGDEFEAQATGSLLPAAEAAVAESEPSEFISPFVVAAERGNSWEQESFAGDWDGQRSAFAAEDGEANQIPTEVEAISWGGRQEAPLPAGEVSRGGAAGGSPLFGRLALKGSRSGPIKGSVVEAGPNGSSESKIAVLRYSHQISRPLIANTPGSSATSGRAVHGPLTIVKKVDSASPLLYGAFLADEVFPTWELKFLLPGAPGRAANEFCIRLTDARIVTIRMPVADGVAASTVIEEISFTYRRISWTSRDGRTSAEDSLSQATGGETYESLAGSPVWAGNTDGSAREREREDKAVVPGPFSERFYRPVMQANADRNQVLNEALRSRSRVLSPSDQPGLERVAVVVAKVEDGTDPLEYAGVNEQQMLFSASMLKLALPYASFELAARVNRLAPAVTASTTDGFFKAVQAAFETAIASSVPSIRAGRWTKVRYSEALTATPDPSGGFRVRVSDRHKRALQSMFRNQNQNQGARDCVHRLGFSYINGALAAAGYFRQKGIWLASDFVDDRLKGGFPSFFAPVDTGGRSSVATTVLSMAQMLATMRRGELVDAASSREMVAMWSAGAAWLSQRSPAEQGQLSFKIAAAKVGHGSSSDAKVGLVKSESALLVRRDGTPFVAVWQNLLDGGPSKVDTLQIYQIIDDVVKTWS